MKSLLFTTRLTQTVECAWWSYVCDAMRLDSTRFSVSPLKIYISLGRWVHYQRVEYWIFQQKGTAKITEERIARLNSIEFEWDPQKAQWEKMFEKLKEVRYLFMLALRNYKGKDKDNAYLRIKPRLVQPNWTHPPSHFLSRVYFLFNLPSSSINILSSRRNTAIAESQKDTTRIGSWPIGFETSVWNKRTWARKGKSHAWLPNDSSF